MPLGSISIRTWDLNEDSTRYDRLQAAPSDHDLLIMWWSWVAINIVATIFVGSVCMGILCHKKTCQNPFNMYLVYVMIPDIVFAAGCALNCFLNALAGHVSSPQMCEFQSFYLMWGVAGNNWINAAIARELYRLLSSSRYLQRYQAPSVKQVSRTALGVYLYAAVLASSPNIARHVSWWPSQPATNAGLGCVPSDYDLASTLYYFLVWLPLLAGIPVVYVATVCFRIWKYQLIPQRGRRRLLTIYFLRIIGAYLLLWGPYFALWLGGTGRPWVLFAGGTFGHTQGMISAAICLTKPDIYRATQMFLQRVYCFSTRQQQQQPASTTTRGDSQISVQLSSNFFNNNNNNNNNNSKQNQNEHPQGRDSITASSRWMWPAVRRPILSSPPVGGASVSMSHHPFDSDDAMTPPFQQKGQDDDNDADNGMIMAVFSTGSRAANINSITLESQPHLKMEDGETTQYPSTTSHIITKDGDDSDEFIESYMPEQLPDFTYGDEVERAKEQQSSPQQQ